MSRRRRPPMLTRLLDEPVRVLYDGPRGWVLAWAFGVRRTDHHYEVLVAMDARARPEDRLWVSRARVRAVS